MDRSRSNRQTTRRRAFGALVYSAFLISLAGCAGFGSSGPSTRAINHSRQSLVGDTRISVIDLNEAAALRVLASSKPKAFSETFAQSQPVSSTLGAGDVVDISIWEAPPAVLFGSATADIRNSLTLNTSRSSTLPEQMIDGTGRLSLPFVGTLQVAGYTSKQVEEMIVTHLQGKANRPQALVRLVRNATANVTVVGEVANSTRVPLSAKGERLLDVLASAGGVRQPVGKTMIQITRKQQVVAMPLDAVVRDPAQNVIMAADDVVTAYFQPFSFTALGAVANNAEIPFEGTGITLSQALGRVGGLRDERADARGAFIFRLEDPAVVDPEIAANAKTTPDGKIPVIYRIDLRNPESFFVAQSFPIRNHDVIYVSNAPIADFQKFVNIVSSMAFSVVGVANMIP